MTDSHAFTHFDDAGQPQMVNIGEKIETARKAIARANIQMGDKTRTLIERNQFEKGDVIAVAQLAGIMGAKKTSDLIPLCHPLPISHVAIHCNWLDTDAEIVQRDDGMTTEGAQSVLQIEATVETTYRTGVEMEALTACTVAALTVYDMCKSVDKGMRIKNVYLAYKSGGKSGTYSASADALNKQNEPGVY